MYAHYHRHLHSTTYGTLGPGRGKNSIIVIFASMDILLTQITSRQVHLASFVL